MLPGGRPPGPPPRRGGSGGPTPARLFFYALTAAAVFLGGYSVGRSAGLAACGGAPAAAAAGCPPAEPCKCDCMGNPDRKLIDAGPKKPFSLPFNVGPSTKYQHVSAEAEGDEQHKGGGGGDSGSAPQAEAEAPPPVEAEGPPPPPPPPPPQAEQQQQQQPEAGAAAAAGAALLGPPKPMAESGKPPAFLAAMFKKEHGGGGSSGGGSEAAPAPAPAPDAAASGPPLAVGPTAGQSPDQCGMPQQYRGLSSALTWLERPTMEAAYVVAPGKHAAEHKTAKVKVQSTLYSGSRSALGGSDVWQLVTRNDWDPNMARALRETLTARPGANVIDVGAWVGTATLLAGVLGAGKVLALEPDPLAFEELWANVRHNPDLAQRTWVYRHCASDRSETVSVTSVVGSTAYLLGGWDAKSAPAGEGESTWSAPCSTIPALAAAHGLPPESVGLLRISAAQPGMELYIGKTVLDWAMSTPPGAPKPGIWLTLHTHKWGDKTLGHHVLMPLVRAYKYSYDTWLNPVDVELAERKGVGPCPKEHNICTVWLTDIPMSSGS